MSLKKFIVDLSDEERERCKDVVKKLKGTSQKVKRANILLKADQGWTWDPLESTCRHASLSIL